MTDKFNLAESEQDFEEKVSVIDDDHSSVFERADNTLYLAKNSGRNAVKTEIDVINSEMVLEKC
jgi:PleD family two-component response regulator